MPSTALEISVRVEETDDARVVVDARLIVGECGTQQPMPFVAIHATGVGALLIGAIGERIGDFRVFTAPAAEAAACRLTDVPHHRFADHEDRRRAPPRVR